MRYLTRACSSLVAARVLGFALTVAQDVSAQTSYRIGNHRDCYLTDISLPLVYRLRDQTFTGPEPRPTST